MAAGEEMAAGAGPIACGGVARALTVMGPSHHENNMLANGWITV